MLRAEDFLDAASSLMDGKTPLQVLQESHQLISDTNRWSAYYYALNAAGERDHPGDPLAVRWSMTGALARCCNRWAILPPYFCQLMGRVAEGYGIDDGMDCIDQCYGHTGALQALQTAMSLVTTNGGR